jgi:hypothetical protein
MRCICENGKNQIRLEHHSNVFSGSYQKGNITMDTTKMSEKMDYTRRRFLGTAALGLAAAKFSIIGSANAQSSTMTPTSLPTIKPRTNTSFGTLKQIDAAF